MKGPYTPSVSHQLTLVSVKQTQLPPTSAVHFLQAIFKRQKEQGQKGRPDDVPYVLARSVRSNLQYQAAAEIGARGGGNMAVRGKCMERAMQMFCGKKQEGIPRAVVEALLRY